MTEVSPVVMDDESMQVNRSCLKSRTSKFITPWFASITIQLTSGRRACWQIYIAKSLFECVKNAKAHASARCTYKWFFSCAISLIHFSDKLTMLFTFAEDQGRDGCTLGRYIYLSGFSPGDFFRAKRLFFLRRQRFSDLLWRELCCQQGQKWLRAKKVASEKPAQPLKWKTL